MGGEGLDLGPSDPRTTGGGTPHTLGIAREGGRARPANVSEPFCPLWGSSRGILVFWSVGNSNVLVFPFKHETEIHMKKAKSFAVFLSRLSFFILSRMFVFFVPLAFFFLSRRPVACFIPFPFFLSRCVLFVPQPFFLPFWGFSRGILVFEAPGPEMCTCGVVWLLCEALAASGSWGRAVLGKGGPGCLFGGVSGSSGGLRGVSEGLNSY